MFPWNFRCKDFIFPFLIRKGRGDAQTWKRVVLRSEMNESVMEATSKASKQACVLIMALLVGFGRGSHIRSLGGPSPTLATCLKFLFKTIAERRV
jgi:hypothetical protein